MCIRTSILDLIKVLVQDFNSNYLRKNGYRDKAEMLLTCLQ